MDRFKKRLFTELGIFILVVGLTGGGMLFFSKNIASYSDKIVQARAELAARSSFLSSLASLKSDYQQKAKDYLGLLRNLVPVKDQLITLDREFQFLAASAGLSKTFSPQETVPPVEGQFGKFKFSLTVAGDAENVFSFIDALQNFRYLTTLDGFTITREGENAQMTTKGQVYFR